MLTWVGDDGLLTSDVADDVAERVAVLAALSRLSEGDREVLILVAWFGLSPAQAAQVLGCTTATYFVRIHRARRRLESALASGGEPIATRPAPTTLVPKESVR
ncbi:sigma factor-like helix-turn-helix DNA-binding protein [Asanoa sp. NPDC049573]|uniref:RNA polymerase sigma factor n=1 Tax=Asanoa sp. NPDC049573 TaxID=3155396 RepID=UPI0034419F3D